MEYEEMKTAVESYLSKKPYNGKVPNFEDKDAVKEMCRSTGETGWKAVRWDGDKKLWGTMEISCVPKLLASGKWEPVGIQRHWYAYLSQTAKAKSFFAEVKQEKQESKSAAITEQIEKERAAALEERKRKEAAQEEQRKLKAMVAATDEELAKEQELGFEDGVAKYALRLETTFGPTAGMSSVGRVLRWFQFKMTEARVKAYEETNARWMTADELEPYYMSSRNYWVKAINEAAKRGDINFDDHSNSKRSTTTTRKKRSHEGDPDMGAAVDSTKLADMAIETHTEVPFSKEPTKVTPSSTNYGGYCGTCHGTVCCQFPECLCSPHWVPCHGCKMLVALHQPCLFSHEVEYPAQCEPLFKAQ
jgi:hypothetical protein